MRLIPPSLAAFCVAACSLTACSRSEDPAKTGGGRRNTTVPVVVAKVEKKTMPLQLQAIGNVRPKSTVAVKPRVTGQISKVNFTEGQDVQEGDVLVEIDPAPFEVVLAQAKARLAQARTQAEIARKQADRYSNLAATGGVSREEVDNFKSTADAASSNTEAAEAAVQEAELQRSYCTVRSPITGRAGRRVVDAGNVVKADETDLVVINQLKPIEVIFSVPEQHFAQIQHYMSQGALKVAIATDGQESNRVEGELTFVDNAIKPATGTLEVKATMENENLALWPGQYGEVTLTLSSSPDAIVVPSTAVQNGQDGQYVFVVKDDQTVDLRPIRLERSVGLETIIQEGLEVGEVVVTDGQLRLTPGAKVEAKPPVGVKNAEGSGATKLSQVSP